MTSQSGRPADATTRELEAGRELDALVAEKVMGWRAWTERRGEYTLCVTIPAGVREPWLNRRTPDPERYSPVSCADAQRLGFYGEGFPRYSTDISAAWTVVDALMGRGWVWSGARDDVPWYDAPKCEARFQSINNVALGPLHTAIGAGDTMPLAICRAALRAVAERSEAP